VTANWGENSFDAGEHIIAPNGVYVTNADGKISAGAFNTYNGLSLTLGDHFIIEKRKDDHIILWQPVGSNTNIKLSVLPGWTNGDVILVAAYNKDQQNIANSFIIVESNAMTVNYQSNINDADVAYYKMSEPKTFIPVVLK
jgi:hypothetical protein